MNATEDKPLQLVNLLLPLANLLYVAVEAPRSVLFQAINLLTSLGDDTQVPVLYSEEAVVRLVPQGK